MKILREESIHCNYLLTTEVDMVNTTSILFKFHCNTRQKLRIVHVMPSRPTYLIFPCAMHISPSPILRFLFIIICKWVIHESALGGRNMASAATNVMSIVVVKTN